MNDKLTEPFYLYCLFTIHKYLWAGLFVKGIDYSESKTHLKFQLPKAKYWYHVKSKSHEERKKKRRKKWWGLKRIIE